MWVSTNIWKLEYRINILYVGKLRTEPIIVTLGIIDVDLYIHSSTRLHGAVFN
jgi:hypothetical protein